jgi:hypothetical protein
MGTAATPRARRQAFAVRKATPCYMLELQVIY